ncbi:MAG: glycosyltransferase family 9 protein [Chlorobium sp.]|nr:glycosyltransferase family 9 protein [Chlorobium sp.]
MGNPSAILLLQLGDIGDVVLTTPCIQALRANFPKARLTIMVREKAAELLTDFPGLDEVIPVRKARGGIFGEITGQLDLVRALRACNFELAIDLRTGTRGAIMARLSGARRRIGFFTENEAWWRNRLFTDLLLYDYTPDLHVKDHLLALLEAFGITAQQRDPGLVASAFMLAEADQLLAGIKKDSGLIVAVQPFSLWQYKELGMEKYVTLIRWLIMKYRATVLITGGSAEYTKAEQIKRHCNDGCYNLAGQTSLALYAALLQRCSLFIGVDSAGLHIAAAVGTPTVSIFGPSSPISWAPQGKSHKVVCKDFSCIPCRQKGCYGSGKSRCLDELTVEEIQSKVATQLDGATYTLI